MDAQLCEKKKSVSVMEHAFYPTIRGSLTVHNSNNEITRPTCI